MLTKPTKIIKKPVSKGSTATSPQKFKETVGGIFGLDRTRGPPFTHSLDEGFSRQSCPRHQEDQRPDSPDEFKDILRRDSKVILSVQKSNSLVHLPQQPSYVQMKINSFSVEDVKVGKNAKLQKSCTGLDKCIKKLRNNSFAGK